VDRTPTGKYLNLAANFDGKLDLEHRAARLNRLRNPAIQLQYVQRPVEHTIDALTKIHFLLPGHGNFLLL
jgi:hypothetical protein